MPQYVRRWAVQGRKPNGDLASTIFDLLGDRKHLMVYPATRDIYAVRIKGSDVPTLEEGARSRLACAIPAQHADHGNRLLGLRPYAVPPYAGAIELYLALPREEVRIVYAGDRLQLLAETFTHIVGWLER